MSQLAEQLIQQSLETKAPYLDLGNCGLKGNEACLALLADCSHLTTLIFSDVWINWNEETVQHSQNQGEANRLAHIPAHLPTSLLQLILSYNQITEIKNLGQLKALTNLRLSGNQITEIKNLEQLKALTSLDLSGNQITEIKNLEQLKALTNLELSGNQITEIKNLEQLKALTNLRLSYNQITEIKNLEQLKKTLTNLRLHSNQITEIKNLEQLKALTNLHLSGNQITEIKNLEQLKALTNLHLSGNQISEIKNLEQLKKTLTNLDLSGNQITEIKNLEQLKALTNLRLIGNQITEIKNLEQLRELKELDLSSNQITEIKNLEQLKALTNLHLSGNQITEIKNLEQLKALTNLHLSGNQITEIKNLEQLKELKELDLSSNQITEIKNLEQLKALTNLRLSDNQICQFPPELLAFPALKQLQLAHNPWQNLPLAIANDDDGINGVLPQVKRYWADVTASRTQVHQAKLVLVGNGRVGKTSLLRRWLDNAFDPAQASTHAIQLRQKNLQELAEKQHLEEVKLNIWDFGGQDIYHTTHRLFMQTQALFVLVWDVATQAQDYQHETLANGIQVPYRNYKLAYWLHYAHSLGERNPVLVVQSKAAQDGKQDPPGLSAALKAQYQVEACLAIDASIADADDNGMNDFEHYVQKLVRQQIKQSCTALPTTWWQTQQAIEQLQQAGEQSLSTEAFANLCAAQRVPPESVTTLKAYFHHSGVFFYREGLFHERIILDQQWAIDAVYTLFDRTGMFMRYCGKGFFKGEDLLLSWQDKPEAEQKLLLSFMEACEICEDVDRPMGEKHFSSRKPLAEREYLVPQLLPTKPIPKQARLFPAGARGLYFKFRYEVLHTAIIHRFILRTRYFAPSRDDIRQHVILLHIKGKEALVEAFPEQNELLVRLSHAQDSPVLDQIRNELEEIQGDMAGIEEWVSVDGKAYVKLANLQANAHAVQIAAEDGSICQVADLKAFLHKDEQARLGGERREARPQTFSKPKNKQQTQTNRPMRNIPDFFIQGLETLVKKNYAEIIRYRELKDAQLPDSDERQTYQKEIERLKLNIDETEAEFLGDIQRKAPELPKEQIKAELQQIRYATQRLLEFVHQDLPKALMQLNMHPNEAELKRMKTQIEALQEEVSQGNREMVEALAHLIIDISLEQKDFDDQLLQLIAQIKKTNTVEAKLKLAVPLLELLGVKLEGSLETKLNEPLKKVYQKMRDKLRL